MQELEPKDARNDDGENSKQFIEYALGGTAILTVLTGLIFLFGWVYLSVFYSRFGLDLWELDLPVYTFLSFPLIVLATLPVATVIFFIIAAFYFLRWRANLTPESTKLPIRSSGMERFRVAVRKPLASFFEYSERFMYVLIVMILIMVSINTAEHRAKNTYTCGGEKVQLRFSPSALTSEDPELKKANEAGALRFLAQTKDMVVVFEKPEFTSDPNHKSVFKVSRGELLSVHYWTSPHSACRGESR